MAARPVPPELRSRLHAEAERIEEDCTYNYVGHYSAAARWQKIDLILGVPTAFLACVAAFTVFLYPAIATGCSIATTFLALSNLYFRPADASHFRSGGKAKALREKARLFHEVQLRSRTSETRLLSQLADLAEEKRVISELGVPLPDFAYRIAKRKIGAGQASYDRDLRESE